MARALKVRGAASWRGVARDGLPRRGAARVACALAALLLAPAARGQLGEVRLGMDDPGHSSQRSPRIARALPPGNAARAHVVWEDLRLGQWMVSHQELQNGQPIGPETILSETDATGEPERNATDPVLGVAADGTVHVAFRAFGRGQERVLAARKPMGQAWQPLTLVNAGVPTEFVGEPALALDAAGRVVVAFSASDGSWDQVFLRVYEPALGWRDLVRLTGDAAATNPAPVFPSAGGHHEGVQVALDELGFVTLASLFQDETGQRRVRVWRGALTPGVPSGVTFAVQQFVDTEHAFGCSGGDCLPDEAAFLDLVAWGDPLDPTRRVALVAWADLTKDANGIVSTWLKASHAVGNGAFAAEVPVSPFAGPLQPYSLDLELTVGAQGRVHALYHRVEPPYCFMPVETLVNAWQPDFALQQGAWGDGAVEQRLRCVPQACPGCGPAPAVFGPPAMCGVPPPGAVVKGFLPQLPASRIASDGTGLVVASWMESIGDPLGYAYIAYALSNDDGVTWSMARPLTTPGGPGVPPGDGGSAQAASPDLSVRGGNTLVVWDDRRSWTDPDDTPDLARGAPNVYVRALPLPVVCPAQPTEGDP